MWTNRTAVGGAEKSRAAFGIGIDPEDREIASVACHFQKGAIPTHTEHQATCYAVRRSHIAAGRIGPIGGRRSSDAVGLTETAGNRTSANARMSKTRKEPSAGGCRIPFDNRTTAKHLRNIIREA